MEEMLRNLSLIQILPLLWEKTDTPIGEWLAVEYLSIPDSKTFFQTHHLPWEIQTPLLALVTPIILKRDTLAESISFCSILLTLEQELMSGFPSVFHGTLDCQRSWAVLFGLRKVCYSNRFPLYLFYVFHLYRNVKKVLTLNIFKKLH